MTKAIVDGAGKYLGSVDDDYEAALGEIVTPTAPANAADTWDGAAWVENALPRVIAARTAIIANGGYGTFAEQLEILGERGIDAFQQHIAAVKATHQKPKTTESN